VGRSAELAVVERAVNDARDGLPSVLLVSGEAGIGKSGLVAEGARRSQVPLYLGRCVHVGGDLIPLQPVADLLRQAHRAVPSARSVADVLALSNGGPKLGDTRGLFVTLLDVAETLAADGPVIIGFEDLHWADEATWDLFEFMARNLVDERVVLVGTHRSNEANAKASHRRRLAELNRLPGARRLHLSGLDRDDVTAWVPDLIGGPAAPALVDDVLARGQGNPFFTKELVTAHVAGEAIPIVLSDLISADIAELDAPTREVLNAVAAVGHETSHELLVRVTGLGADSVEQAVRAAIDAQLLVVDNEAYWFRHALIGEVVYADVLPPQRVRMHRRIAEVIAADPAGLSSRADRASELAFHLDRTGDARAAFVALLAAADIAESVAPGAAFRHLERALDLWELAGEAATGECRSHRMWQAAELADATVSSARAVELARAAAAVGPPAQGDAWGHERLGRYLWASGRVEESQTEFEHAASLLTGDVGPEAACVFAGLGQADFMAGRFESADRLSRKAIELTSSVETDPLTWVLARHVQGSVRNHLGEPDAGVELCRDAFLAAPTAYSRGVCAFLYGVVLLSAGRTQEAINVALDAVAEGQRAGLDGNLGALTDTVAAEGLIRLGRWNEAEAILDRHATDDSVPLVALRLGRARAMLAARRGQGDRARELLDDATAHPADGMHLSYLLVGTADVHLILRDWTAAASDAELGWGATPVTVLLWSARFAMLSVEAGVELALDAIASRQPIDLADTVAHLQERIDAVNMEVSTRTEHRPGRDAIAHLAHATATLSRLTTPDPDAWAEAARRWSDLGDRWWTAVARLREAEAAASAGTADRAATALRVAHALAADLGAVSLVAEVEAVSRRTRISIEEPTRVDLDESSISHLGLTPREAEVLTLVSGGRTNRQIGEALFVSEKTAGVHVSNILRKLGVSSRVDAAAVAQRLGVA
jgi:DNA-binding CsgD family transcriptional regulator/tetratricopeptide (TPR) repeat protein